MSSAAARLGQNGFAYEVVEDWGKLPDGWVFEDVSAVAVDDHDRVYAFSRGRHPMIVFDKEGNFLRSWGEGVFTDPHGLQIGADGAVYCTDYGDHTVRKCTPEGRVLLEIGVAGKPSPFMSGLPFHRCTHTALSPTGDIYVSDGYGNACIHKFSPDGKLIKTWGRSGSGPGEFYVPHTLCCDADGWVYVADRENHRIQVFDGNGSYETQWGNLHRPLTLCRTAGPEPLYYVSEASPTLPFSLNFPNLGPRISILDSKGQLLVRLGDMRAGVGPGKFIAPHGLAVDSTGNIYVGELTRFVWPTKFPNQPLPARFRTLHKLKRVTTAVAAK